MNRDMYFLPLIAQALGQQDARHALVLAFEEVAALGRRPEYARGHAQFRRFMELVAAHRDDEVCAAVRRGMIALASDTCDAGAGQWDAAFDLIAARPGWQSELDDLYTEAQRSKRNVEWLRLVLAKSGRVVRTIGISSNTGTESVSPISPGTYTLGLETGSVLWENTLREADLLWSQSARRRPLKLAAETPGAVAQPTREVSLLGGELSFRVFAGIEAGRIEVEWRGRGVDGHVR